MLAPLGEGLSRQKKTAHQLLPPPKHTGYNLRSRGHGLTLSVIPSEFMRKNFINRMLFNDDIY